MVNNTVGGNPRLLLQWQQQLLRLHQKQQKRTMSVQGVWWLNQPKAAGGDAAPDKRTWTCPRCGSRQCIRTNPGNLRQPVYCCVICGYRFGATAAGPRLLEAMA